MTEEAVELPPVEDPEVPAPAPDRDPARTANNAQDPDATYEDEGR